MGAERVPGLQSSETQSTLHSGTGGAHCWLGSAPMHLSGNGPGSLLTLAKSLRLSVLPKDFVAQVWLLLGKRRTYFP